MLDSRRHTLQASEIAIGVPTHQLHEGIAKYKKKKEIILPPEIIEQYSDFSREVCMFHSAASECPSVNLMIWKGSRIFL